MRNSACGLLVILLLAGCVNTEVANNTKTDPTPETKSTAAESATIDTDHSASSADREADAKQQLEKLSADLESAIAGLKSKVAETESEAEKVKLLQTGNPVPKFIDDALALSREYSDTSVAVDAALAAIARAKGETKDSAMNYVLDNFSDQLNLEKMADSFLQDIPSPEIESYLHKMIANAQDDKTKAHVMLTFSNYVDQIFPFRNALLANPVLAERLPAAQMAYINTDNEAQRDQRIEYLQSLINDFPNTKYRGQMTYADVAEAELYELQNLSVGMVAPDIIGKDLDGMDFKLSDYRGKIIMLDFWGHWCPPCRQMYPHEQQLVEKLGKAPFALIGVNTDKRIKTAINAVENDNLSWRNFWDGPQGTEGPISKRWNISAWPTVYLIDADGVIRHKDILGDDLNAALQQMLSDMGHDVDLAGIK